MLYWLKNKLIIVLTLIAIGAISCSACKTNITNNKGHSIVKVEMHLSALGVESDNFPSIDATIDFLADSSYCRKWFYNPIHKDSIYKLTKKEIRSLLTLIDKSDFQNLKKEYTNSRSDQPSSKLIIYSTRDTLFFNDYGLEGAHPLKELYNIVYKY